MAKTPEESLRIKIIEDLIKTKLCSLSISNKYGVASSIVRTIGTVTFGDLYFQREHMALSLLFKFIKDSIYRGISIRNTAVAEHLSKATYYKYYNIIKNNNKCSFKQGRLALDPKGTPILNLIDDILKNKFTQLEMKEQEQDEYTFIELKSEESQESDFKEQDFTASVEVSSQQSLTAINSPSHTLDMKSNLSIGPKTKEARGVAICELEPSAKTNTINISINGMNISYTSSLDIEASIAAIVSKIQTR